jgi:hypothetical protein
MISKSLVHLGLAISFVPIGEALGSVPATLSAALEEHQCVEVAADSALIRFSKNWWMSLQQQTGADTDYVFMCQAKGDPLYTRLVVHTLGPQNPWKGCDRVVTSRKDPTRAWWPLGVEVVKSAERFNDLSLGRWWQVLAPGETTLAYGPPSVKLPELVIDTSAQDAGSAFACYAGRWYRIGID